MNIERNSITYANYHICLLGTYEMDNHFKQKVVNDLSSQLTTVRMREYFHVKPEIFADSDYLIIAFNNQNKVIGILASKWYQVKDSSFLHIRSMFISEKYQGTSLFKRMWHLQLSAIIAQRKILPDAFSLKTYNPISVSLIQQVAKRAGAYFYPLLDEPGPSWLKKRIKTIAQIVDSATSFDTDTGCLKNSLGSLPRDFYRQQPKSLRTQIMNHFNQTITPEDRLLCCLFCNENQVKHNILNQFGIAS